MATNMISALGAGSGIDVKALAESLVEAERAPRKEKIDEKITKSEAKISGYAAIKYALTTLKSAFEKLNDATDFSAVTANNSQTSVFSATTDSSAVAGRYSVEVTQLASAQTSTSSTTYAAVDTELNSGTAFSLYLSINSATATEIEVDTTTPTGIVEAINDADLGVTAELIQTDDDEYTIVLTGSQGSDQSFTLTSEDPTDSTDTAVTNVSFGTRLQTAADAVLEINGLEITRSTNTINDVIDGVTFELYDTNTNSPATLSLLQNTSTIKESIQNLVAAYNDFNDTMTILLDRQSEVEQFGGALAGDSLAASIRTKIRALITADSTTPGTDIEAARDVGISFDRDGKMTVDETTLDAALLSSLSDVVTMFSADTNNKSLYSSADAGLGGDAVREIDEMLRYSGLLTEQTDNITSKIDTYKVDLEKLEIRMQKLLTLYTQQFSVMESVVGNTNSMRTSLTSSFEGMMNAYKN
jgi:flagellar hook-associated protein 2